MKTFVRSTILFLAALVSTLSPALAQTFIAQSGVSLLTSIPATATATNGPVRLPTFSGVGTLTITGTGITGSPSGCTVALAYQSNNSTTATAAVQTISFTPAVSVTQTLVSPSQATGDNFVATYACSSTYPTAGTLSVSFSPITAISSDPCFTAQKNSVSIAISTATTTSIVPVVTGAAVYVCGFTASFGATTTAQFEYGTSTNCTGTHALTGVFAPATGAVLSLTGEGQKLQTTPVSQGVCIVSTGTGGINGYLSYVQQ